MGLITRCGLVVGIFEILETFEMFGALDFKYR